MTTTSRRRAAVAPRIDARRSDTAAADRVEARPDGFYWVADDGQQEFGPFATATLARAAAGEAIETAVEQSQALQDAEAEIGVTERLDRDIVEIDEQTGEGEPRR